ncbi:hypothetical protein CD351_03005 [Erythrobacter sp. KY5]|uniref:DUF5996 family protein n=1 Tax=Erythrobacter sp. KY5 TaxID=2011159 RepID=UPI000DBF163D|nr:DUF5996 family protein [Erythrobacter sp. KY5]AWW73393.1 hypothetical protein CD351_03005 [Erythrobacter sp. KY5]
MPPSEQDRASTGRWPFLDYAADKAVIETCHAYLQIVGKLPTRGRVWTNHGWQLALRVTPRGFRTYTVGLGDHDAEMHFDCLANEIVLETSAGFRASVALHGQSVAELFQSLTALLERAGISTDIGGAPNEVEPAIPFKSDDRQRHWDESAVRRFHAAFRSADRVFTLFRSHFVGKSSPSHLFWGSFDLAVTRFSGKEAPLHPGGVPNLPDRITREAYSHEVASAGFWLGGSGIEEAAFYAYGYPAPDGLSDTILSTPGAYWHAELGEFILPYAKVAQASDPDAALLSFLLETYEAIATRAGWDRAALEIPGGQFGQPYDMASLREGRV